MEDDDASLARTDSMSQSQRGPRHRRMESVETRSSMDLNPDTLLQVGRRLSLGAGVTVGLPSNKGTTVRDLDTFKGSHLVGMT